MAAFRLRGKPKRGTETREQPPEPVNTSLHQLLELVNNATDPWLLFLYGSIHYVPGTVLIYLQQESHFPLSSF